MAGLGNFLPPPPWEGEPVPKYLLHRRVRTYWDEYLEYNPLRTGPPESDAGAFLAFMIEAAGDVLRELAIESPDEEYICQKLARIRRSLPWRRDWTDPLSPQDAQRLAITKQRLEGLPAPTNEARAIKELLRSIMDRDVERVRHALEVVEGTL